MAMTEVILRPARLFDMADCAAIVDRWIGETPWLPRIHDAADIARHYRENVFPSQAMTVAEAGGRVAGFMARDGDCITSLYLDAAARGRGIGAQLLAHAKTAGKPLMLWTSQANDGARRFYLREGFREGRRTADENEERLPDIQFLWTPEATP